MKWKKLGKIFDPSEHDLPGNCFGFAQAPQALVLDDRVRIYFSTREQDQVGKFLSHISFVDFDLNLSSILGLSTQTVIPLGSLGTFDEHGIFPIHVTQIEGRILAYTTGWNRKISVPADAAIGFAESNDKGLTFDKLGNGPVLASSLHEPFLVGDAYVLKHDDLYHMWYIFGSRWIRSSDAVQPERVYKIAHATSCDGVSWERSGLEIIPVHLDENECQALPTVFFWKGRYHMYFCYRDAFGFRTNKNNAYRLGYAYSNDLITWVRDELSCGIRPSKEGWDSEMQCYPNAFSLNDQIYLLYNGNEFGRTGFGLAVLEGD